MARYLYIGILALLVSAANAADLQFEKVKIGDYPYEAACVFDVNGDGHPDILSGEYWHAGPDFTQAHRFRELLEASEYFDDFGDWPMDVDGDGDLDVVYGGWFGKSMRWSENPGAGAGMWPDHEIDACGNVERPLFVDVDGDGTVEAAPNLPGGPLVVYKLVRDAAGKGTFKRYDLLAENQDHGLGFGDINGDGRGDFVLGRGWVEAPPEGLEGEWTLHEEFDVGHASVPILVYDVNEDGKNDLIAGLGHDFGLFWWEQGEADGKRTWTKHVIEGPETKRSQFHDMALADLDKDGKPELVTGKRYRAHNGNDPGSDEPVGLYYYTIDDGAFTRHVLDYGAPGESSGAGIYLWCADVDGNGWTDVVAPGKEGLFLFKNMGK